MAFSDTSIAPPISIASNKSTSVSTQDSIVPSSAKMRDYDNDPVPAPRRFSIAKMFNKPKYDVVEEKQPTYRHVPQYAASSHMNTTTRRPSEIVLPDASRYLEDGRRKSSAPGHACWVCASTGADHATAHSARTSFSSQTSSRGSVSGPSQFSPRGSVSGPSPFSSRGSVSGPYSGRGSISAAPYSERNSLSGYSNRSSVSGPPPAKSRTKSIANMSLFSWAQPPISPIDERRPS